MCEGGIEPDAISRDVLSINTSAKIRYMTGQTSIETEIKPETK